MRVSKYSTYQQVFSHIKIGGTVIEKNLQCRQLRYRSSNVSEFDNIS